MNIQTDTNDNEFGVTADKEQMKLNMGESIKQYGKAWTGTSNIVLPGTKKSFPEAFQSSSRLTYYASLFNSVEINSSFYKVPMPVTFEKWSNEVPEHFQFTVKLWRNITHAKTLAFDPGNIDIFMKAANRITLLKKGCLLIQFPASITIDYMTQVDALLQRIQQEDTQHPWRKCVEFRHSSWYTVNADAMLDRHNASLVLHDMPASKISLLHTKANFVYLRFHGVKGDYKGTYDNPVLQEYAAKIINWLQQGKDVYTYFNNTIGEAFENAQELNKLVQSGCKRLIKI
jgi:uncharacterized protein YecE (DUF72 family)